MSLVVCDGHEVLGRHLFNSSNALVQASPILFSILGSNATMNEWLKRKISDLWTKIYLICQDCGPILYPSLLSKINFLSSGRTVKISPEYIYVKNKNKLICIMM